MTESRTLKLQIANIVKEKYPTIWNICKKEAKETTDNKDMEYDTKSNLEM